MKRFLIVKTSSLGDIVHTWPVANYLRTKFPGAQVDWVVESRCQELVATHPEITRTLCIDIRRWRKGVFTREAWDEIRAFRKELRAVSYDAVFDLQGNAKSALITLQARAKVKVGYGWRTAAEWPNALSTNVHVNPPLGRNIREDYLRIAQEYFKDTETFAPAPSLLTLNTDQQKQLQTILQAPELVGKERMMVCPGSAWRNKQLEERALLDFLKKVHATRPCAFIFVWGSPDEQRLARELKHAFPADAIVVERLPFPVLQHLMNNTQLVFAMDSLALHLAGTTSAKTFGFFGPSLGSKYIPLGEGHRLFQGTCPYGRSFSTRCPIMRSCPTGACLREVGGDALFESFLQKKIT